MKTGTVDVRTRDTERHGKMRVDQLRDMLIKMKPAPSKSHDDFYSKIWDVKDYEHIPAPEVKQIVESKNEANEAAKREESKSA